MNFAFFSENDQKLVLTVVFLKKFTSMTPFNFYLAVRNRPSLVRKAFYGRGVYSLREGKNAILLFFEKLQWYLAVVGWL